MAAREGASGWLPGARRMPSPNFDARPLGAVIDLLVIHNISLPPGQFETESIEALFTNRLDVAADPFFSALGGLRVSSHFVIDRKGEITQFVDCTDRAWHAGVSEFEGRRRCNDFSIGVELIGSDFVEFEPAQYAALAQLTAALRERYAIRAVRGHQHIATERKTDPGPFFDWWRFARETSIDSLMLPDLLRPEG
jgi:N-acetyl-anhydromuramoyl-L-alanine amidase